MDFEDIAQWQQKPMQFDMWDMKTFSLQFEGIRNAHGTPRQREPDNENGKQGARYYNLRAWKDTKRSQKVMHPYCVECAKKGIRTPTTQIHHIKPFLEGTNHVERMLLLLNPNNLMALCDACHVEAHRLLNKRYESKQGTPHTNKKSK